MQFCDVGWDKCSYGYHGDDGNSFCSSGPAQPYGPTFTTGDVIGCCLNLVDNVCFYTKNGINLGDFYGGSYYIIQCTVWLDIYSIYLLMAQVLLIQPLSKYLGIPGN